MSLPPSDMRAASDKTATRSRFTKRDWIWVGVLTLALSATYLLINIMLDPALLPHAARAGRLPVLLLLVGIGFFLSLAIVFELRAKRTRVEWALNLLCCLSLGSVFPIGAIVWLDPYQPNARNGSVVFTALGLSAIGLTLFGLALVYGLSSAHRRYSREGAYAESGVPGREEVVGLGSLMWAATSVWFLAVVSASIYAIWLALTSPFDNASLPMPFVIVCSALVLSISGLGWIWWYAGRYARRTGDAALLASTTVPSTRRAAAQRVVVPPDERARWGVVILIGLGLFAFSLLTFAILDFYYVQSTYVDGSQLWLISALIPLFSLLGLHRASARRYPPTRFRRLLVAAAAFVVAGDAMWLDSTHPHHSIVSPLGLLIIAVLSSTLGVLICRLLLLNPMGEGNPERNGTAQCDPALLHNDVTGSQKRPRVAPYLVLLQPLLFVAQHLLFYGDASVRNDWEPYVFLTVIHSIIFTLAVVVNTDMPLPQAPPAKKAR